jgi:hypothetical protein
MINNLVQFLTGKDLLGAALPTVTGDWGALRRQADAMGQLRTAYDAIAEDIETGMDLLNAHWSGDDASPAAAAFDGKIRQRWVVGFRGLADVAHSSQQTFTWLADAYAYLVNVLLLALNFYSVRITGALKALAMPIGRVQAVTRLALLVDAVVSLIEDTARMIEDQTALFIHEAEMIYTQGVTYIDLLSGDLDVFDPQKAP